jgi:transcriptional regulator with XRE-family HTH domain
MKIFRRIYTDKDFLQALEDARLNLGLTMEEVSELAGVPDRYYSKVKIGMDSQEVRDVRAKLRKRQPSKGQTTVRRPFVMRTSAAWMAEACGLAVVIMPVEDAARIVEPDPVTELTARMEARKLIQIDGVGK